ncbi:protein transporter yif1 [Amanita muscaria]
MASFSSPSPPPLRHPVPTHPAYIPEPPSTPASPTGYQRYTSSPGPPQQAPAYPTHVPAYTTPFQHSQPQPPHMQQMHHGQSHMHLQQATGPTGPTVPAPEYAAWGLNDATAQLGMQVGRNAVEAGQRYVSSHFGTIFPATHIKHHFNVSNSYVIKKLQLLLFPWLHKPWARRARRSDAGHTEWQPPRDDINCPDLYIPSMALVTYVLLAALHSGLNDRFHPKVLGESASRALGVLVLDFFFVKLGCYFLNVQGSSQMVDLIAYGGYKFIGVILTLTAGFLKLPSWLWTAAFIYAFLANAFFLLRSLRSVVLPDPSIVVNTTHPTTTVNPAQRRRRITFLFLVAVCQILYMGILVRV